MRDTEPPPWSAFTKSLALIPKLINSYKVSVKYGSEHTEIEFDTHYRDENGQSVSYIDINKGINIVINST